MVDRALSSREPLPELRPTVPRVPSCCLGLGWPRDSASFPPRHVFALRAGARRRPGGGGDGGVEHIQPELLPESGGYRWFLRDVNLGRDQSVTLEYMVIRYT